jgi:hypothetical protein
MKMNKNVHDDSNDQQSSEDGYSSVYHQTTTKLPEDFSTMAETSCDPEDVLTIFSLLRAVSALVILLAISIGTNVFLAVRKADRIIVDKSSGRVVELNNRDYGATETVEIAPDKPNDTDKKYLVKVFLKSLYEVEQTTRESEINKLLRMLDPDLSLSFAARLKQNGLLAAEKAESVNSSWELQDLSVDERDPYILRAIGVRKIRRQANGQDVEETLQLKIKFLLKDSPASPARNDNNLRTGFTIVRFRVEPVSGKTQSPIALLADGDVSGGEIDSSSDQLVNPTNEASSEKPQSKQ